MTITLWFNAFLILFFTGLGAMATLASSQLLLADEGTYHLGSITYVFDEANLITAYQHGSLLGLLTLVVFPLLQGQPPVLHWLPMTLIALLTAQSLIDLKYYELADEWTFLIGIFAVIWRSMTTGLTLEAVGIAVALFAFFFVAWFFTGFPGYGDVKLVLAGGFLITSWVGAYFFLFYATLFATLFTLIGAALDGVPVKQWASLTFAFGPYLCYLLALATMGVF